MIRIERGEPPKGNKLDGRREKELQKIRKAVKSGKPYRFETLWSDRKVKNFLYESQHGKCCYCERKRDEKRDSDVEHFRPKTEVEGAEDHPGYWWLAYSWENLLIACKTCNEEYKKSKFPLKPGSKRACEENSALDEEKPILINPLEEDPEMFIDYDTENPRFMGKAVGKCERGRRTVDELTGINDMRVMNKRARKIRHYRMCALSLNNGVGDELRTEAEKCMSEYTSGCSPFSGFARFYFKKMGCL